MANPVLSGKHFQDEAAAFAFVEAALWPHGPVCPHCGEKARIKRLEGKAGRPGLCQCNACRKQFTVRIGTIFESSHLALHLWLQVIHLMCASKKGVSTRQIQRLLNCSMKTAWFLTHRIREVMAPASDAGPLGGEGKILEADEAFIGAKAGRKLGRPVTEKAAVFALVEREGRVRSRHVADVRGTTLRVELEKHASPKSRLMTDEHQGYSLIGWNFASHEQVHHGKLEFARGDVSTNTVEGYFSILKRGLDGVYQHVSEAHLQRYLAEFDFRYSHREKLGVNDVSRAAIALKATKGKRLTYRTIGAGQ
jgi:transposase-like protein